MRRGRQLHEPLRPRVPEFQAVTLQYLSGEVLTVGVNRVDVLVTGRLEFWWAGLLTLMSGT